PLRISPLFPYTTLFLSLVLYVSLPSQHLGKKQFFVRVIAKAKLLQNQEVTLVLVMTPSSFQMATRSQWQNSLPRKKIVSVIAVRPYNSSENCSKIGSN